MNLELNVLRKKSKAIYKLESGASAALMYLIISAPFNVKYLLNFLL